MNTRLALAFAALLAPASAFASVTQTGPNAGRTGFTPAPSVAETVWFDGQLLSIDDVQADYASAGFVVDIEACEAGDGCAFWFVEQTGVTNRLSEIQWDFRITMMTEEPCNGGEGCQNGFLIGRRLDTSYVMDGVENEVRAEVESSVGWELRAASAPAQLTYTGRVEWIEGANGALNLSMYDADDIYLGGYAAIPSSGSAAVDVCDAVSGWVVDGIAVGAAGMATSVTFAAVGTALGVLDVSVAATGVGAPFAAGAAPGLVVTTIGTSLAAGALAGGLVKGLATYFGTDQFCSTFVVAPEELDMGAAYEDQVDVNTTQETSEGFTCPAGETASVCEDCVWTETATYTTDEDGNGELVIEGGWDCVYYDCCL